MRANIFIGICILTVAFSAASCNNEDKQEPETKTPALKEENITYTGDGITMNGFVVYDSNNTEKRPAVLVVHEWWGMNDYAKKRAKELADLGYIAMALDMFGEGRTADNPDSAMKLAGPFYGNKEMAKARFDAALAKLKSYNQVDPNKIAAIGYCFGGAMVLNMAKLGDDLAGVVSFHGNLNVVPANKDLLKAKILVCHGADDPLVPQAEVDQFKKQMDSIGASYTFKAYPGAVHAFTNPAATAVHEKFPNLPVGYNAAADSASWKDMKEFFGTIFK
ncbi:MAG: dienelactone hydrolase family protein [Chitinophagaceae bacterium]|nr:dienelactone hydrolase family protein [Chitinophagaceae bacterium]